MIRFAFIAAAFVMTCPTLETMAAMGNGLSSVMHMKDMMTERGAPPEVVGKFFDTHMKNGFDTTKCTIEMQPDREGT